MRTVLVRNRDRGAASVCVLAVGLVLVLLGVAFAAVGQAIGARHRAQVAADFAALAGGQQALSGASVACGRAAELATANGALLTSCTLDGLDIVVRTEVATRFGPARAAARAGPVPPPAP